MVPLIDALSPAGQVTLAVALLAMAAAAVVVTRAVLRWRGTRLIQCPETRKPAAVELDVGHVVVGSLLGQPHLRLRDCSRWPERSGCGQDCLAQVERGPQDCLVRTIVADWYAGKPCVYCRTRFGEIHWHDHPPALRDSAGVTRQWTDVRPEALPRLFETHQPVCWNCHVAESFRRQHPDLVIDRPPRPEPPQEPPVWPGRPPAA